MNKIGNKPSDVMERSEGASIAPEFSIAVSAAAAARNSAQGQQTHPKGKLCDIVRKASDKLQSIDTVERLEKWEMVLKQQRQAKAEVGIALDVYIDCLCESDAYSTAFNVASWLHRDTKEQDFYRLEASCIEHILKSVCDADNLWGKPLSNYQQFKGRTWQDMIDSIIHDAKYRSFKIDAHGNKITVEQKYSRIHIKNRLSYLVDGVRVASPTKSSRYARLCEIAFVAEKILNKVSERYRQSGELAAVLNAKYFLNDSVRKDFKEYTGMKLTRDKLTTIFDAIHRLGIVERIPQKEKDRKPEHREIVGRNQCTKYTPTIWLYSGWLEDNRLAEQKKNVLKSGLRIRKSLRG